MKIRTKIFFRSFLLQALWNFENMQGVGFLYAMMPKLKELYSGEKLKNSMIKYLGFFNTHPYMVLFVLGRCARIESEKNIKFSQKEVKIRDFKLKMGGPLAALGDKIFWSTYRPFMGMVAVIFVIAQVRPKYLIPAGFLLVYNIPVILFKYQSLISSFFRGDSIADSLARINTNRFLNMLPFLGMLSVGAALAVAFIQWGPYKGTALLVLTATLVVTRMVYKMSATTLVYAVAALGVSFSMFF